MGDIRFDGKVVVVTGAGGGLGRSHALLFAQRGAKVVVNDLGVAKDGTGQGSNMADKVVQEIKDAGGEAVANYDSVSEMDAAQRIIDTAINSFGKIDILINNAGILRDVSFKKMTLDQWQIIQAVHLNGTFFCTKAAWPYMTEQKSGKIINTTSAAGLFGNFGQANYAAAKMGIVGIMNALKEEGAKYNVFVNTIAPLAASRLTEGILPPQVLEQLKPEYVSSLVSYLCSDECKQTGGIYEIGGGYIARVAVVEAPGVNLDVSDGLPPEKIGESWKEINSLEGAKTFQNLTALFTKLMTKKK